MAGDVRCVMFDLDDTLWECKPVIKRAEALFYEWCGSQYPQITARFSPEALLAHRIAFCREQPQWHYHLTRLRKNWLSQLGEECGADKSFVEAGFEVYWLARNEVSLLSGVEAFLIALKSQYTVGAITNGNADISHIGLDHLFDFSVTAIEAGVAKPDKGIFLRASEKAGIPLHEMLHVGDDWNRDVQGALNAGAQAAWVSGLSSGKPDNHVEDIQPHYEVESVLELRNLIC